MGRGLAPARCCWSGPTTARAGGRRAPCRPAPLVMWNTGCSLPTGSFGQRTFRIGIRAPARFAVDADITAGSPDGIAARCAAAADTIRRSRTTHLASSTRGHADQEYRQARLPDRARDNQ